MATLHMYNAACLSMSRVQTMRTAFNSSCEDCACHRDQSQPGLFRAVRWGPSNENIFYHIHISKTGGTSLWRALEKMSTLYFLRFCVFFR